MAAVYKFLVATSTTAALVKADLEAQITTILALTAVEPKQVTVLGSNISQTVNAASADAFTGQITIQYNTV